MKDESGAKIIKEFVSFESKKSYLIDEGCEGKKTKGTKKCVIKRNLKFEDFKNCLEATQLENIINHLESSQIIWKKVIRNFETKIN